IIEVIIFCMTLSVSPIVLEEFWPTLLYNVIYKRSSRVVTVVDRFVQQAQQNPDKAFLICEGATLSYGELEERSNRVARVFQHAVKKGDTVALLMSNEPDFIALWLGFCSFLNTNIRSGSLLHCFRCCGARLPLITQNKAQTGCLYVLLRVCVYIYEVKHSNKNLTLMFNLT
uniref:Long-chain-fatty-acid--CoA ligase n=1 Tax=Sinocyclocheilus anshuiensis TaxID=1608454 RepID=A0A671SK22_9TELE